MRLRWDSGWWATAGMVALLVCAMAASGCGVRARVLGAEAGVGTLAGPGAQVALDSQTTGRTIARVTGEVSVPDFLAWVYEQIASTAVGRTLVGSSPTPVVGAGAAGGAQGQGEAASD